MAEAQARVDSRQEIDTHVRAIKGHLAGIKVRCRDRYIAIGGHLVALRKLVPDGEWAAFIRDNFEFSTTSAGEYMRFYRQTRAHRGPRPTTLDDIRATPRPDHQPRDFRAYRKTVHRAEAFIHGASREHAPEPETGRRSPHAHKLFVREMAHQIIQVGYRLLAQRYHPDRGGASADMAALSEAKALLDRLLRRLS